MLVIDTTEVDATTPGEHRFTAGVRQELLLDCQVESGMRVLRFSYAPGEHSHWHSHEGEQAILVESGRGWIKTGSEEGFAVKEGDLVYVPKNAKHWHGATPDQVFVHLAVNASGNTASYGEVTEEAYVGEFT